MRRVLDEAREAFDWIIIDTPPVALLPDANLLSAMVDGAVMVIKAGSTAYPLVKRAVEAITRPRILGVVLNQAESVGHESSYYHEYGSRYYSGRTSAEPPVSP
jgi:Mrp family chromosome partitioning ATPase